MKFLEPEPGSFPDGYDPYRYDNESVYLWRYPSTRVDCRQSLDVQLKNGKFAKVDDKVTKKNFPFANRKINTVHLVLVQFMWNRFESKWALEEMAKIGLEPARIEHLLTFRLLAMKEPADFHAHFFTQACGSTTPYWGGKPGAVGIETWDGGMDETAELVMTLVKNSNTSRVRLLFTSPPDWKIPVIGYESV